MSSGPPLKKLKQTVLSFASHRATSGITGSFQLSSKSLSFIMSDSRVSVSEAVLKVCRYGVPAILYKKLSWC